ADRSAWANELDIFRRPGKMNEPASQDRYIVEHDIEDSRSNLKISSYTAKSEDLPVQFLRIYYDTEVKNIRKLEALYREKNALYSNIQYLTMGLQDVYDNVVITSYGISG